MLVTAITQQKKDETKYNVFIEIILLNEMLVSLYKMNLGIVK